MFRASSISVNLNFSQSEFNMIFDEIICQLLLYLKRINQKEAKRKIEQQNSFCYF